MTGGNAGYVDIMVPIWHVHAMNAQVASLRQRQAQQVRSCILDAVLSHLETKTTDDVSMAEVAGSAGISLRTLYRHFPDRSTLLVAAGEHLYASLGVPVAIAAPKDISKSFREAAQRLATRPRLTRALVRSEPGRLARSGLRRERIEAIGNALKPVAHGLKADLVKRATAVITHLCGASSWVEIADESGLSDSEAQTAVSWAIDALIEAMRRPGRRRVRQRRTGLTATTEERT